MVFKILKWELRQDYIIKLNDVLLYVSTMSY